jgi:hypothetical protein
MRYVCIEDYLVHSCTHTILKGVAVNIEPYSRVNRSYEITNMIDPYYNSTVKITEEDLDRYFESTERRRKRIINEIC